MDIVRNQNINTDMVHSLYLIIQPPVNHRTLLFSSGNQIVEVLYMVASFWIHVFFIQRAKTLKVAFRALEQATEEGSLSQVSRLSSCVHPSVSKLGEVCGCSVSHCGDHRSELFWVKCSLFFFPQPGHWQTLTSSVSDVGQNCWQKKPKLALGERSHMASFLLSPGSWGKGTQLTFK